MPAGNKLAIDRRILPCVVTPQDFDYKPAIADGRTVTLILTDRRGENLVSGWTPDGDILAVQPAKQAHDSSAQRPVL